MKAFLLAAGYGTRLKPLTDHTPKCLLPIRGTPLLEIWMKLCQRHGIDEVLINLHAHASQVAGYLASHRNGVRINVKEEKELLGSAGTVWESRDWIMKEDSFWIFYADVLTTANLGQMHRFHAAQNPVATLGVSHVSDPTRCGIVTADQDGTLESFVEKPARPRSSLAFSGIMLATPRLLDKIPSMRPVDFGFDILPLLAGQAMVYEMSEYLLDIGTRENYEQAQATWPGLP